MTDVLTAERAHLARARADLARMRERTRTLLDTQKTWGNDELTTRALTASLARRFEQLLDDGVTPLFFGRLDTEQAEVFHVGRRHVSGADGEPVVLDWRAPVAGAYYRASAADRQGLELRRRFGFRDGVLTAYEDDRLTGTSEVSALLLEEVERPRSGPMRDIVATVQPEQDVLVRAPLERDGLRPGRSRHRQDGGRPAPGRLPALRPPRAARRDRRPGRRSAPGVPVVRAGGPAGARRGAGDLGDGRRARTGGEGAPGGR